MILLENKQWYKLNISHLSLQKSRFKVGEVNPLQALGANTYNTTLWKRCRIASSERVGGTTLILEMEGHCQIHRRAACLFKIHIGEDC